MEAWKEIMTPGQVSEYLQLNKDTVYRYIREGKLIASKLGRSYRITRRNLDLFLLATSTSPADNKTLFNLIENVAEKNRDISFDEVTGDVEDALAEVRRRNR